MSSALVYVLSTATTDELKFAWGHAALKLFTMYAYAIITIA